MALGGPCGPWLRRSEDAKGRTVSRCWRCWALVIVGISSGVSAAAPSRSLADLRVRVLGEAGAPTKGWERFALACATDVEDFAGAASEPPSRWLRIHFGQAPSAAEAKPDPFGLVIAPTDSMEQATHRLVRRLLQRQFTSSGDANPPLMPSTQWLAAALTSRILFGNRERSGRFVPDYEPARYAFQRGAFPDIERLLTHPVPPEQPVLYRLYALHADLLALCVSEAAGPGAIGQILALDARGREPAEALRFVVQDALQPGETLQGWYCRTVVEASRRGRRPSDTVSTAERFLAVTTVPMVAPGEHDFRGNRQPLEDVPEKLQALHDDPAAVRELQRQLFELIKDAPYLLQVPVSQYADACRNLGSASQRSARNALRKARHEVEAALERQTRLVEYLEAQERRHVPAEQRLALPLDVVHRYARSRSALDPELARYLDGLSR